MKALFTFLMVMLLNIVFSNTAWADLSPAENCANSCSKKINVCLNVDLNANPPVLPNMAEACKDIPECKYVVPGDMQAYSAWFASCLKDPGSCHAACVPPAPAQPAPGPATTTTTTQPPPPKWSPADQCKATNGYYVEETTAGGRKVGKCWRIGDAYRELQELRREVAQGKLNEGMFWHIFYLTNTVNDHTAFLTEARKVIEDYDRLRRQVDNHETRIGNAETNIRLNTSDIAGIKGQLGMQQPTAPGQSTAKLVFTGTGGRLPCWLGAFGQLHAYEVYGSLLGSAGAELGCSLFGTENGRTNFVLAPGVSYATNGTAGHKRYAIHVLTGPQFRIGDSWKIMVPLAVMRTNTWSFERGSNTWCGVLPEVRYLFSTERWSPFIGVRVGLGATHYAHPTIPGIQDTRFDPTFWGVAGIEFDPFNTASKK
ncbi:MAG: hypothetical protein PHC70_04585 [Patescibacteria group bacterium]|nr:hypothetical protein [Patescibacteria group bacterium]